MEQLSPMELKEALARAEPLVLLDVREPWEFDYCRIGGSQLIPLGELHERAEELDKAKTYVLICHHGVRSMHALHLLRHLGFEHLKNLRGGVEAWSAVEPGFPRY
ncbi:MAG TPA: rhodanese-like domain-containing protein [Planctomycetota bacterium]|nr:rhodanese-like domain-containing protein [Planctomycetota bacterium]